MLKLLSTAGLALTMTLGGMAAPLNFAQAQDLELRIGPDGVQPAFRDRDRDRRRRDGCDPEEARDLARDAGLRRAQVVRVSERRIVIEGMTRRGPERMTFANRRGCPEL